MKTKELSYGQMMRNLIIGLVVSLGVVAYGIGHYFSEIGFFIVMAFFCFTAFICARGIVLEYKKYKTPISLEKT